MNIFSKQQVLWEELARIFHAQDSTRAQNAENKFLKGAVVYYCFVILGYLAVCNSSEEFLHL